MAEGRTRDGATPKLGRISQEAFDEGLGMIQEFSAALCRRAAEHMKARDSRVLTDTDMRAAYRDLTIRPYLAKLHRAIGDSCMVMGGAVLSTGFVAGSWTIGATMTVSGAVLVAVGVYVREFARSP